MVTSSLYKISLVNDVHSEHCELRKGCSHAEAHCPHCPPDIIHKDQSTIAIIVELLSTMVPILLCALLSWPQSAYVSAEWSSHPCRVLC